MSDYEIYEKIRKRLESPSCSVEQPWSDLHPDWHSPPDDPDFPAPDEREAIALWLRFPAAIGVANEMVQEHFGHKARDFEEWMDEECNWFYEPEVLDLWWRRVRCLLAVRDAETLDKDSNLTGYEEIKVGMMGQIRPRGAPIRGFLPPPIPGLDDGHH